MEKRILGQKSDNIHLREERGQVVEGDDDVDEEARYSSVLTGAADAGADAAGDGKYRPPQRRGDKGGSRTPASASCACGKKGVDGIGGIVRIVDQNFYFAFATPFRLK